MARLKFNWTYKGGVTSAPNGVGRTAYAVIADYIQKNKHKTAEQLRSDLNLYEKHKIGWDGKGTRLITLHKKVQTEEYYFPKKFRLESGEVIRVSKQCWGATNTVEDFWNEFKNQMVKFGYTIEEASSEKGDILESNNTSQEESQKANLLQEFKQIILYGPPGTGKTYRARKEMLPQLLGVTEGEMDGLQGKRWDIVQFHPSYNYEDFVRGVKVETSGNNVAYKTVNRTFGDICERAGNDSGKKYALIIDEINRANVSAVLGELIYALEYRGKKIKTPYTVDGAKDSMLVIPENLYIIGTMNTADRTIGQIDYAVRRRFAFEQCLPDESIIEGDDAIDVFYKVEDIFKYHISPDYDANDVRIGHSYFLLKHHENLAHKIIYQVIPILREYVKDGILLKGAESKISTIEEEFSDGILEENGEKKTDSNVKQNVYCWEKDGRVGINNIGRTVLSIAHDYVKQNPKITLEELQEWFPDRHKQAKSRGIKSQVSEPKRFFNGKGEELIVNGKPAYVTTQWGSGSSRNGQGELEDFIKDVKPSGYAVRPCYVVNIGENEGKRNWDACREFGFVSVSSKSEAGIDRGMFKKIEKGAIVFAFLVKDKNGNRGFVGMGEVLDSAVPINQFMVEGAPILDYKFPDGNKYSDKYSVAAKHANENDPKCDWMIRVNWKKSFPREEAEGKTGRWTVYCWLPQDILQAVKNQFEGGQ